MSRMGESVILVMAAIVILTLASAAGSLEAQALWAESALAWIMRFTHNPG